MAAVLIRWLGRLSPERRRLWAARLFIASLAGWAMSAVLLVELGQSAFFQQVLLAISWLAITITAADVICTTDVKTDTAGADR
jgi:hypothetical protein